MSGVRDALTRGAARLAEAGVDSARLDARLLLGFAMELAPENLLVAQELTEAQSARFETLILRRESREPLAYIVGQKEFWSLDFEVGPGVLVPRPETETLIEEALRDFPDRDAPLDIADLGTGSGCLLIAFLESFPNAKGTGIDRSADALVWARRNAARHGVQARCVLSQVDWNDAVPGSLDVLFSNPPYVSERELSAASPEIIRYEPRGALAGGEDGLNAYRELAPIIARCLRPDGRAYLEIGSTQAEAVASVLERDGLRVVRTVADLAGHPRCLVVAPKSAGQKTVGNPVASG
jgi:release factor glutamine methyltransferase